MIQALTSFRNSKNREDTVYNKEGRNNDNTNVLELLCLEDFYKCSLFGSSQKPFNIDRNWFDRWETGTWED